MMTTRNLRAIASMLGISISAAGCGVSPKVVYEVDKGKDKEGYSKFQLQRTTILIDRKKDKDGKDTNEITLSSVPTDSLDDPVYTMIPADSFMVKTHLKVTHRPNTNLIESLGTEIEDQRVQFIQQVGALVTGLIGLAGAQLDGQGNIKIPSFIDVTRLFIDPVSDETTKRGQLRYESAKLPDGQTTFDVKISPVSKDAIERTEFLTSIKNTEVSVLFYSACRDAQIQFTSGDAKGKVFNLRISDPNFIQTVKMPPKGKIELHTGCGVNVTSEKADIASDAKVAAELIAQVKTVREAFKSADGKTTSQATAGTKK